MTRRLRPPAPLRVQSTPDGRPVGVTRGGRRYAVTRITSCWVRPAAWWSQEEGGVPDPLLGERTYYQLVLDGVLVYEVFVTTGGGWYVERILD